MGDTMTLDPLQRRNEEYMVGGPEGGPSRSSPMTMKTSYEDGSPTLGNQTPQTQVLKYLVGTL